MIRLRFPDVAARVADWFSALLPDWVGAMFWCQPLAAPMTIVPDGQDLLPGQLPAGILTGEPGAIATTEKELLVDLFVPPHLFLQRKLSLPVNAKSRLEAMAALDLRTRTPLVPDEIYWKLGRPERQAGNLLVSQWIVRRSDVEDWQRRLHLNGYRIQKLFVDESADCSAAVADFSEQLVPVRRTVRRVNAGLATVTVLVLLLAWLFPGWSARTENRKLQLQLEDLRSEALLKRREAEDINRNEAQQDAFLDNVLKRPLLLDTIRELTVALGDDVWVSELTYDAARIVLGGEARNSAAMTVLTLSEKSSFQNPRLTGPVSRTASGAEKFEITLDLEDWN